MSQHNIVGSEVFGRRPSVFIRQIRPGAFHRRRGRTALAFAAGAGAALIAGLAAAVLAFGPQLVA